MCLSLVFFVWTEGLQPFCLLYLVIQRKHDTNPTGALQPLKKTSQMQLHIFFKCVCLCKGLPQIILIMPSVLNSNRFFVMLLIDIKL